MPRLRVVLVFGALIVVWAAATALHGPRRTAQAPYELLDLRLSPKQVVQLEGMITRARELGYRDEVVRRWTGARLQVGELNYRCKVRLRGDNPDHWAHERVSLRVRLEGDETYRGCRELNLILAWDRGYFMEDLARWWSDELGLLPLDTDLVRVRVNGEDRGFYVLLAELDKNALERAARPEAPVFRAADVHTHGRSVGIGAGYRRVVYSQAFFHLEDPAAPQALAVSRLLEALLDEFREWPPGLSDLARLRRVSHLLDLRRVAALDAACRVLGPHPQNPHNAVLYFDAASGLFEPALLDPIMAIREPGAFESGGKARKLFSEELLACPEFRRLRDTELERVVARGPAFQEHLAALARWAGPLASDPQLLAPWQGATRGQLFNAPRVRGFVTYLRRVYGTNLLRTSGYLAGPRDDDPRTPLEPARVLAPVLHVVVRGQPEGAAEVRLRHDASAELILERLTLSGPDAAEITSPDLAADGEGTLRGARRLPAGEDVLLRLSGYDVARHDLSAVARWTARPQGARPPEPVVVESSQDEVDLSFLSATPPELAAEVSDLRFAPREDVLQLIPGDYTVRGLLVFPRGPRLVIPAGTTLRFAPGAALVSYSPLTVAGTPTEPVVLDELLPGQGWGGVAVMSTRNSLPGLAGKDVRSQVQHLVLRHARGFTLNGVGYTGALSFFASDVDLRGCLFVDAGGDDALNVKRADLNLANCVFVACPSDALDADWCGGSVVGNLVLGCGGDGVDLSGAEDLLVTGNAIICPLDKGVSVGEASRARLVGNLLAGGEIAVAAKDLSQVTSSGNLLFGPQTGLTAYQKKRVFGGGHLASQGDRGWVEGAWSRADPVSTIELTDSAPQSPEPIRLARLRQAVAAGEVAKALQSVEALLTAETARSVRTAAGQKPAWEDRWWSSYVVGR